MGLESFFIILTLDFLIHWLSFHPVPLCHLKNEVKDPLNSNIPSWTPFYFPYLQPRFSAWNVPPGKQYQEMTKPISLVCYLVVALTQCNHFQMSIKKVIQDFNSASMKPELLLTRIQNSKKHTDVVYNKTTQKAQEECLQLNHRTHSWAVADARPAPWPSVFSEHTAHPSGQTAQCEAPAPKSWSPQPTVNTVFSVRKLPPFIFQKGGLSVSYRLRV